MQSKVWFLCILKLIECEHIKYSAMGFSMYCFSSFYHLPPQYPRIHHHLHMITLHSVCQSLLWPRKPLLWKRIHLKRNQVSTFQGLLRVLHQGSVPHPRLTLAAASLPNVTPNKCCRKKSVLLKSLKCFKLLLLLFDLLVRSIEWLFNVGFDITS